MNTGCFKKLCRIILFGFSLTAAFPGCGLKNSETPMPPVDYLKAKDLSDAVAGDLVREDVADLFNRLDPGFHMVVSNPKQLRKVVKKMYGLYGQPEEFVLKASKAGVRTDGDRKRPSLTFFYSVKTTRYPWGEYFLKIETVPAHSGGAIDVSGFGFFTYADGNVPGHLR